MKQVAVEVKVWAEDENGNHAGHMPWLHWVIYSPVQEDQMIRTKRAVKKCLKRLLEKADEDVDDLDHEDWLQLKRALNRIG